MPETQLLTITEARQFEDLQPTYDTDRFNAYVTRVQRGELRHILSRELYFDLFQNVTDINTISSPYDVLVNGTTYIYDGDTIQYYGIKPFLAYHVFALMVDEGYQFLTDTGTQEFTGGFHKRITNKPVRNGFISEAVRYGNEITQFLDEKNKDYPLWEYRSTGDPQRGSFMIY